MATTPTQLPVPSEKPQDLKFNAGKVDEFVTSMGWTYSDRFGVKHYTIEGLRHIAQQAISAFGYITIDSFEDGATISLSNQVLRWKNNGEYYRWDGDYPAGGKVVASGSTPLTTGGVGLGAWISVGDAALRGELVNARSNDLYANHQRRILTSLPLFIPDNDAILLQNTGTSYMYPQGLCEYGGLIYITYPFAPTQTRNVIAVYNKNGVYQGYYYVDAGGPGYAPEGIVVTKDSGSLKMYVGHVSGVIREFDLSSADYAQVLPLLRDIDVGLYNQFSYRKGTWLVEQQVPEVGQLITRTVLAVFDKNFRRVSTITLPFADSGYITEGTSDYSPYFNKRQGFALGDGFIVAGYGGYFSNGASDVGFNEFQGSKVFNIDGSKRTESILNPQRMMDLLSSEGFNVTRIENEGIAVSEDGRSIYSLYIHQERLSSESYNSGIIIFDEYSNSPDAIDFSPASEWFRAYDIDHASIGVFPRSKGGIVNPVTGEYFTNLTQILQYMQKSNQKMFSFYTGTVSIVDISGNAIPASTLVEISSANNQTFMVEYKSPENGICYIIATASSGAFIFLRQRQAVWAANITVQQNDSGNQLNRLLGMSYSGTNRILMLDQQSTSPANGMIIGGGSGVYNSATTIDFATNPDNTALGGTVRFRIAEYGMRPFADNAYTFGQANFRLSTIYAATGTINTSDGRMKTKVVELSVAEKAVAVTLRSLIRRFKLIESVQEKGDDARYHIGIIAQDVKAAFEAQGLVAEEYGILCHDVWEDEYAPVMATRDVINESGETTQEDYDTGEIQLITAAGDRYSVRYEELLCFIIGAM
ncbi:tail fiber domain-containing protein [Rahnella inusitata]|uniref:tail fiber/spike domain-containing protein n=1 Tax=Rahnella inusitata TaxID=58169 RepID=UPI0039BDFCEF